MRNLVFATRPRSKADVSHEEETKICHRNVPCVVIAYLETTNRKLRKRCTLAFTRYRILQIGDVLDGN